MVRADVLLVSLGSTAARSPAVVVPIAVEPSGPAAERDLAAVTYAADPHKKGLDRVLAAWTTARRGRYRSRRAPRRRGVPAAPGVRDAGRLPPAEFRALLRRARVYVTAPRREDYGLAQLEALADGALLVTTPAPGPYAALPIARALDERLVSDDLAGALRAALDDPLPGYADRAASALGPYRREAVDATVQERLLPALLSG